MALVTSSIDAQGIATITLCDEANLNAMSEEMAAEFAGVVTSLRAAAHARVVILTGAGKAFSAGGHLTMLDKKRFLSQEENKRGMLQFYDSFLGILELQVPLIAALHGAAVGAGLCLACACDIRIAASDTKLGFTFLKLGLHPGMGGTFFVPRVVGRSVATELLMTGRIISADDALRIGLVSQVCSIEALTQSAYNVAREIIACGPSASQQLLETMRSDVSGLRAALEREAECQSINYIGSEFAEGIAATREKRVARFSSGRS